MSNTSAHVVLKRFERYTKPSRFAFIRCSSSLYPVRGLKAFGVSLVHVVHLSRKNAKKSC